MTFAGKVVATTQEETKSLDELASRGNKNGLKGLKYLSRGELKLREPFVRAEKALLVPEEGIVDYAAVMQKMVHLIQENKGQVFYNTSIKSIEDSSENEVVLSAPNKHYTFDYLVSCEKYLDIEKFFDLENNFILSFTF